MSTLAVLPVSLLLRVRSWGLLAFSSIVESSYLQILYIIRFFKAKVRAAPQPRDASYLVRYLVGGI